MIIRSRYWDLKSGAKLFIYYSINSKCWEIVINPSGKSSGWEAIVVDKIRSRAIAKARVKILELTNPAFKIVNNKFK